MDEEKHRHSSFWRRHSSFWRIVGLALGGAIGLSLLYAILRPAGTGNDWGTAREWSDALCTSALLLGLGSGIPFLLDAGRGLLLPGKMGTSKEERLATWDAERAKREKGIRLTFALALAAAITGFLSLIISLL